VRFFGGSDGIVKGYRSLFVGYAGSIYICGTVPNAGMRVAITAGRESTNLQGSSQIAGFMKDDSEFKQLLRDAGKNDLVMR
jgi:hypothetical protein